MGQQYYVIKRMPPVVPGGGGGRSGGPAGDRKGPNDGGGPGKPGKAKKAEPESWATEAASAAVLLASGTSETVTGAGAVRPPQSKRTAGSRKNKKRRR